jgi:ATP-binding cassette subfamily E protein 1
MATYLADQVVVFEGEPGAKCVANSPSNLIDGMNKFL